MVGMSAAGTRYAAFISYSHSNETAAARLHRALESFRIPKDLAPPAGLPASRGRIAPVFRDREELSSSPDLSASIRAALETSYALIVLCSPASAKSRWVNEEIKLFKRLHGEARVFAFLIEGEPAEAFPPALLKKIGPDGEPSDEDGEPLAADIRPGKDGWKIGTLKVAAGLLGVGLDALRQRELQRERRRLMATTGLSVSVAAMAVGLSAWALYASNVAEKERARAEREAKTAQATTEFMVDLFEVNDPGEARGREVTAKEILDKGVAKIEEGLKGEPAVQGELMYAMGRVYTGLGLYPDAADILANARQKRIAAAADEKDVYATENALARALFEKGDLDGAKAIYEKLVAEAEAAIARGEWRVDFATAMTGMGETALYKDTAEEAQKFYERARDLLASHGIGESEEMAEALRGLGGALVERGEYQAAVSALKDAAGFYERTNQYGNYRASVIESDLAYALYRSGQVQDAARLAERVLEANIEVLGQLHPDTIISQNNLVRYQFESGQLSVARNGIHDVLNNFSLSNREQHFDYVYPLNTQAEINLELGHTNSAITEFGKALSLAKDNSNRLFGPINLSLGRAMCATGKFDLGLSYVKNGRDSLAQHYLESDWRYAAADEFESRCRAAMGETGHARSLARAAYERFHESLGDEHFFTHRSKKWLTSLN